jgi:hypothetical protein
MILTDLEKVLSGSVIASISALGGFLLGGRNKISKEDFQRICNERQSACTHNMCIELKHIKEEQSEMKKDVKELLKRVN